MVAPAQGPPEREGMYHLPSVVLNAFKDMLRNLMIFILQLDKIARKSKTDSVFSLSFVHFKIAYPLQVLWLVPLQNLHEKLKMHDFDYQQCTKPAYTQKNQHFDAKSA